FLNVSDVGKPHVVVSTTIAREHPNADGKPKRTGESILIGTADFTIVGLYETGSVLFDSTIIMDIGEARKLLALPEQAVSTFVVEPAEIADSDALAERIENALPGVHA